MTDKIKREMREFARACPTQQAITLRYWAHLSALRDLHRGEAAGPDGWECRP